MKISSLRRNFPVFWTRFPEALKNVTDRAPAGAYNAPIKARSSFKEYS